MDFLVAKIDHGSSPKHILIRFLVHFQRLSVDPQGMFTASVTCVFFELLSLYNVVYIKIAVAAWCLYFVIDYFMFLSKNHMVLHETKRPLFPEMVGGAKLGSPHGPT